METKNSAARARTIVLAVILAPSGIFGCAQGRTDSPVENAAIVSASGSGGSRSCTPDSGAHTAKRLMPSDLVYQGAFRLPDGPEEYAWLYSGQGLTYCPSGDPSGPSDGTPGSLFGIGHDWHQWVSEVSIPVPVNSKSKDLDELNTAETIQPFADIRGKLFGGDLEQARGDIEYLPAQGNQKTGKLFFCWGPHMHDAQAVPSHGMCELNLKNPQSKGLWKFGNLWTYLTCDYIFSIDPRWADRNTPGMPVATGRFRDGGQGSMGPSLFAFEPLRNGNPAPPNTSLKTTTLLRYGSVYDGPEAASRTLKNYHHADDWAGGSWLSSNEKSAVIFVGTKGTGKCWYGFANGVVWPEEGPWPKVPPAPNDQRGWWSSAFVGEMLFYDPEELALVAGGRMEPWEPQPYAVMELDPVLYGIKSKQQTRHVGDVTFDRERGLVYMIEFRGDGDKSLVHVWKVDGANSASSLQVTVNARVQEQVLSRKVPSAVVERSTADAAILIDHNCVDSSDAKIPQEYLDKARQLDFYFAHQSVGSNILDGLGELAQNNSSRYSLKIQEDPQADWFDETSGLGHFAVGSNGDPHSKTEQFLAHLSGSGYGKHVKAAAVKFCFVDIEPTTDVDGVFSDYRETMEALGKKFPGLRIVWITCPLVANGDNSKRHAFNQLMRQYCAEHKKILFDLADIEAYTPEGKASMRGGLPSLYRPYSQDGEHPDSDSGRLRLARGWWWMVARLAGWDG